MSAVRSRQRAPNQNSHLALENAVPQMAHGPLAGVLREFSPADQSTFEHRCSSRDETQHGQRWAVLRADDQVGGFDEAHQLPCAVVRRHVPRLVAEQVLAVLLAHARCPESTTCRVTEVVSSQLAEPKRSLFPKDRW